MRLAYPSFASASTLSRAVLRTGSRNGQAIQRPFPFIRASFGSLLIAFLLLDVGLILLNVLAVVGVMAHILDHVPDAIKITGDLTIPEDFNYIKWALIAAALLWLSVRERWLSPLLWALVFLMILADDSLQLHETLGDWISQSLGIPDEALIYGRDVGEISVFGGMGLFTLAIFGFLLTRKDQATRLMTIRYILLIAGLGFVGVGLDLFHSIAVHLTGTSALATVFQQAFGMLEDGGEMLIASIAVALTLAADPGSSAPVDQA